MIKLIDSMPKTKRKSTISLNHPLKLTVNISNYSGEVSITTKKISESKQEQERHSDKKKENQEEIERLKHANSILSEEIAVQLQVIQDRDKTIGENERKIYDLKKKSQ